VASAAAAGYGSSCDQVALDPGTSDVDAVEPTVAGT
jgi:hypothetical protein